MSYIVLINPKMGYYRFFLSYYFCICLQQIFSLQTDFSFVRLYVRPSKNITAHLGALVILNCYNIKTGILVLLGLICQSCVELYYVYRVIILRPILNGSRALEEVIKSGREKKCLSNFWARSDLYGLLVRF